ncbi:MAG TPA: DUF3108 domain-containing protein [Bacteroidales bacterium]|nr:DUF3108 domain-containing protein [Bacteroidales bacterium]HPI85640.1 DUF3108 domain-containing protein [Bacteroidales bacterium]HPM91280.1 DUF3108 domain-containing protein [Bacteroidales bacterium]
MSSRFQIIIRPVGKVFHKSNQPVLLVVRVFQKSVISNDGLTLFLAPTTKAVGSYGFMKVGTDGFSRRTTKKSLGLRLSLGFLFLFISNQLISQDTFRKVENNTFQHGEFLKYRVFYDSWVTYWMTAGYGTMEISPEPVKINGRDTYHITVNGNSAGLFNVFYKVRDKFETYMDKEGLMPLKFIRYTREGGYKKDDTIFFDHQARKAVSIRKTKDITQYVQDIVSAFYYVRSWDFDTAEVNDTYYVDFFLDDSLYHSEIVFMGRESVRTDFGTLPCMRFKPRVAVGELFQDPYPMELWVTDDRNKIPVLMKSAVFIGSVKIELVEYRGLRWPFESH